jgi:hypothetical protein
LIISSVAQRPDRLDVPGSAAEHELGFLADRENLFAALDIGERHHRGFVQHDAAPLDIDQRVGRAEIDRHIGRKQTQHSSKHRSANLKMREILTAALVKRASGLSDRR